jgi:hypothetical protein
MKTIVLGFVASAVVTTFAAAALAQDGSAGAGAGPVVASSQFTDKVEGGKPSGDASSIGATATYFVVVQNAKEPTAVTLRWKLDGEEVGRQTLDVGVSPRWRTWGSFPTRNAHTVAVDVLDKDGNVLKTDSFTKG